MNYPGHPVMAGLAGSGSVQAVQKALNAAGVGKIAEDGVFGPETEAAVRLFQARSFDARDRPLTVDGVVGPLTWAALFNSDPVIIQKALTPLAERVLATAASQVGVLEDPQGSNRGPQVDAYLDSVGLGGGHAWCAAFVHWCFDQAREGAPNPCPRTGGVHELWRRSVRRLRYTPAQVQRDPSLATPGQLFFLDHGSGLGHVGFIEAVEGVYLTTIEGNTNGGGSREGVGVFRRRERKIAQVDLGFADLTRSLT